MTKTTQINVPISNLAVGIRGPFTSGTLPADLTGYVIDFTNDNTWPASGEVCVVAIEQSNDNGNIWAFDASLSFSGGAWKDRQGNVVHTAPWSVSLDNKGSTTRRVRATVDVQQACRLGAVISSV